MDKDKALKLALEALEGLFGTTEQFEGGSVAVWRLGGSAQPKQAITAIKEALAQHEYDWSMLEAAKESLREHMARIKELEAALAQPAQEPVGEIRASSYGHYPVVAWVNGYVAKIGDKFYTTPPQRERVVFPTMLRKMWSGGEVQAWLDENVNKEKNGV